MNRYIIIEYIKKINRNDIINYANKQGISLNNDEIETIYYYIKHEYNRLINKDESLLEEIKDKLNNNAYNYIKDMYYKYNKLI
jgi:hypothetical protein